jgi:hypothetical protein
MKKPVKNAGNPHHYDHAAFVQSNLNGEPSDPPKWIGGAIKHPGALHKQLGVPMGKKIPASKLAAAAKKGGKLGKRARLAETLKGFH